MVVYGSGIMHPPSFCYAMIKIWKCELKSFKIHFLKDNVFYVIFSSSQTRDYVLNEGPYNRLLLFHPWNPIMQEPPAVFDSAHFNFCITGLSSWCICWKLGLFGLCFRG